MEPSHSGCLAIVVIEHPTEALPPFKLPDNATQSGFLTRSTKDGAVANANMIQFEDKK